MLLLPTLFTFFALFTPKPQTVEVTITGLHNNKGQLVFGAYRDQATFDKEASFIQTAYKKNVVNGKMTVTMQFEPGVYGLTMVDDENADSKMQYFLGLPKEGFGFSNLQSKGFSKPKFDDFKFTVTSNAPVKVTVPVRYIL
jgi:uncharacterized protein (DUF2141 family)